jgi:hypothetical protein
MTDEKRAAIDTLKTMFKSWVKEYRKLEKEFKDLKAAGESMDDDEYIRRINKIIEKCHVMIGEGESNASQKEGVA